MPRQCPSNATILQLLRTNLAGEGTIGLVKNILCRDFDALAEVFAGKEEIESCWGDDNLLI